MNQEAIRKLRLAHKYQKEALMELIPENIRGNVMNIDKEMKEIAGKVFAGKCITSTGMELMKAFMSDLSEESEETPEKQEEKVRKVDIE